MGLKRSCNNSWIFLLIVLCSLLFTESTLYGQWKSVNPPTMSGSQTFNGVHFISATDGWAVGADYTLPTYFGVLLHYHNGVWTSVSPPAVSDDWEPRAVHFTSATDGWAVGFDWTNNRGVLLHYQDVLWSSVIPPDVSLDWGLSGVHFTSLNEGWAVGNNYENSVGLLLHYQGGLWTVVAPPIVSADWGIQGTYFFSPNDGWVVGYDWNGEKGVLLHYHSLGLWPNDGTIGTQVTLSGTGFGEKKGKVLIGGVATKIVKDGWKPDSIACTVTKAPSIGTHNVIIKPYKADDIILSNAFTMKHPVIEYLDFYHDISGKPIVITGNFFSTKKGKVYLEHPVS